MAGKGNNNADAVKIHIDGILDLHAFHPRDMKFLIPDYLAECRKRGILEVRLIHGKGTGSLRRTIQAILKRLPGVCSFALADEDKGGWGATIVTLLSESKGPVGK